MKVKVTYIDGTVIRAVIFELNNGWYNFGNDLQYNGVQSYHVITKVETILEAGEFDIIDNTQGQV